MWKNTPNGYRWIGSVVKERRLEKGLLLRDVAERIGVSIATVSFWESGQRYPRMENYYRLKGVLEL